MRNVQANVHFDEGDRLQVQELEGCAGVVVLRCGTASGITMFFDSTGTPPVFSCTPWRSCDAIEDAWSAEEPPAFVRKEVSDGGRCFSAASAATVTSSTTDSFTASTTRKGPITMPANAFTGLMHCADCGLLWSGSRWYRGGDGPPMERREEHGAPVLVDTYPVMPSAWCSGCTLRLVDEEGRVWTNAANLLTLAQRRERNSFCIGGPRPDWMDWFLALPDWTMEGE